MKLFGNQLVSMILACSAILVADASETIPLNRGWQFRRGEITGAENPGFNAVGLSLIHI